MYIKEETLGALIKAIGNGDEIDSNDFDLYASKDGIDFSEMPGPFGFFDKEKLIEILSSNKNKKLKADKIFEKDIGTIFIYLNGFNLLGGSDNIIISENGKKLLGDPYTIKFRDNIDNLFIEQYFEYEFITQKFLDGRNIMIKIFPGVPTDQVGVGGFLEYVSLSILQQQAQKINGNEKRYEFIPNNLYLGTNNIFISEWIETKELPNSQEFIEAREQLVKDLKNIDESLDLNVGNILYRGKNSNGQYMFSVIDQPFTKQSLAYVSDILT